MNKDFKRYQIFVDISNSGYWNDIQVLTLIEEAESCEKARKKAKKRLSKIHKHFYVWEVTNNDELITT